MYLHLGQGSVVPRGDVVGIFDLDGVSRSGLSRDFLARAQRDGLVTTVDEEELPASFVLCRADGRTRVFLSPITAATLAKRARETFPLTAAQ
ncbi:MAG: DUF370 domain-containing protein [Oscillospiraceae bacterium]|jgi:hypothetical protein|nr:DUF370 domain-containing protein [Oscillospiraceae bacterium]